MSLKPCLPVVFSEPTPRARYGLLRHKVLPLRMTARMFVRLDGTEGIRQSYE